MAQKIIQNHLLKGSQEFEILEDSVNVKIKPRFGQEEVSTVMLAILNSEPIITKSYLEFTSRVNNEPLLTLFLAKPNQKEFNDFVNILKHKIQDEFNSFAGLNPGMPSGMEANIFDDAPDFDNFDENHKPQRKKLKASDIDTSITMLKNQIHDKKINDFIYSLEELRESPLSDECLSKVMEQFRILGPLQGAVLAYAPYIIAILSDDPYDNF
tara:strand:+ start:131 stop:766 length:636 start_codon:yes stop_codon:yes gene_type:complete